MSSWGGPPTCLPNRRPLRPSDFGGIASPAGRTTSTREGASDGPSGPRRPCADQPIRLPVLPPCPFTRTASPAPTVGSRGISTVNPGASERFLRFPEPPPFSLLSPPAGLSLPSPENLPAPIPRGGGGMAMQVRKYSTIGSEALLTRWPSGGPLAGRRWRWPRGAWWGGCA